MDRVSLHSFSSEFNLPKSSVYAKCKLLGIATSEGLSVEDCDRLMAEFGITPTPTPEPEAPTVTVESGNHNIVLAAPELPQTYSLEGLRSVDAVSIDDPLAVAAQFLQVADQLTAAMQSDIQQRESKLQQTRQAKEAIAAKAQELQLEKRFYQERANLVSSALSQETNSLQNALTTLQTLGKPAADGGGSGQS